VRDDSDQPRSRLGSRLVPGIHELPHLRRYIGGDVEDGSIVLSQRAILVGRGDACGERDAEAQREATRIVRVDHRMVREFAEVEDTCALVECGREG
jgi:hypothetical protein